MFYTRFFNKLLSKLFKINKITSLQYANYLWLFSQSCQSVPVPRYANAHTSRKRFGSASLWIRGHPSFSFTLLLCCTLTFFPLSNIHTIILHIGISLSSLSMSVCHSHILSSSFKGAKLSEMNSPR